MLLGVYLENEVFSKYVQHTGWKILLVDGGTYSVLLNYGGWIREEPIASKKRYLLLRKR